MFTRDAQCFELMYNEEVFKDPNAKKYQCYLRAEARYYEIHGCRKYGKYGTFRAMISRRRKVRREQLSTALSV